MYLPKTDVLNALKTLNYHVSQNQPPIFNSLPAIIFKVGNNSTDINLDNEIDSQDIEIIIDIYAESSVVASRVLSEVEEKLRTSLFYKLSFSNDIPNGDNLFHIYSRFTKNI